MSEIPARRQVMLFDPQLLLQPGLPIADGLFVEAMTGVVPKDGLGFVCPIYEVAGLGFGDVGVVASELEEDRRWRGLADVEHGGEWREPVDDGLALRTLEFRAEQKPGAERGRTGLKRPDADAAVDARKDGAVHGSEIVAHVGDAGRIDGPLRNSRKTRNGQAPSLRAAKSAEFLFRLAPRSAAFALLGE